MMISLNGVFFMAENVTHLTVPSVGQIAVHLVGQSTAVVTVSSTNENDIAAFINAGIGSGDPPSPLVAQ